MINNSFSLKTNRNTRINFFYQVYLMRLDKNTWENELQEIDFVQGTPLLKISDEVKCITNILLNKELLEDKIKEHLPIDWKWGRINNLEKSILLNAIAEIIIYKNSKAIVIDEAIKFCKKYTSKDSYKLINGILDNF